MRILYIFILIILINELYKRIIKKYEAFKLIKVEYKSIVDMYKKCCYNIAQEIVHNKSSDRVKKLIKYYKEICNLMKKYKEDNLDVNEYIKFKKEFYINLTNN